MVARCAPSIADGAGQVTPDRGAPSRHAVVAWSSQSTSGQARCQGVGSCDYGEAHEAGSRVVWSRSLRGCLPALRGHSSHGATRKEWFCEWRAWRADWPRDESADTLSERPKGLRIPTAEPWTTVRGSSSSAFVKLSTYGACVAAPRPRPKAPLGRRRAQLAR
jgi:hypothetical protein